MEDINRILIQLKKAIDCANSELPQENAISVILFDNLIEFYLFKTLENEFLKDKFSWDKGKKLYTSDDRNKANKHHQALLKLSVKNNVLNQVDSELLEYAHGIRNTVYHKGFCEPHFIEIAITLYIDFLKRNMQNWRNPSVLICISDKPGLKKIDFGQNVEINNLFDYKHYFKNTSEYLLNQIESNSSINSIFFEILTKKLNNIKRWKSQIEKDTKELNFYKALTRFWYYNLEFEKYYYSNRKPKNLDSILIIFKFIRENQDDLDKIDNLKKRQIEGKKRLKKNRLETNGIYPYWIDFDKFEKRVNKLKNMPINNAIQHFINLEKTILYLYEDIDEASSKLSGYIQELIDFERGK